METELQHPSSNVAIDLVFDDPRLRMTIAGRFFVRVISYIAYLFLFAAMVTFLIAPIPPLFFLGLFLVLFFIDKLVHRNEGDLPIVELPSSGKINVADIMMPRAFGVLEKAFDRALLTKRNFFLVVADRLAADPQVGEGLRRLDVRPEEFRKKLDELLAEKSADSVSKDGSLAKVSVLALHAFENAISAGHNFVRISDLFSGLLKVDDPALSRLFSLFSIDVGDLEMALILGAVPARRLRVPRVFGGFRFESHHEIRHRIMNRAWTARPTPMLDRYSTDFTDLARDGRVGFLIGHTEEYEKVIEALARPINPNALLVGEAGIGKETLVAHLAFRLVKDDVPRALFDKRLVALSIEGVCAGAPPEELNARLTKIVEEIDTAGNIILYIPDIHNLVHTSGAAYLSAADILMPVIMNDRFPILGATYPREFKQFIEPRSDFVGAFEVIPMSEISMPDAEKVLTYESLILERDMRVTISFGAIKRAVVLAKKYFRDKYLPASAEELLKSALVSAEERGERTLGPDRISAVAEAKTHIPMHEAQGEEAQTLLHMEDMIHEHLVGQDEAVTAVAQALREYRSGLVRPGGPIASFLFVGPTGVGKTELAKILAKIQFGSEKMMVRFDMTEYQDKASFTRFIGSPDGTTSGALTEAVREKPYCLILLDEFEKAFPDILNLFLQVFDDGRLTDNLGRVVDFTNTIIIATSNAHSDIINESLSKGESMANIAEYLKTRLTDVFKPELLNRFSKIVVFKNLEPADLQKIVQINLADLAETAKAQGIFLEFDPAAVALLVKLGYDPAFGARPLRRAIDEKIRAPLAEAMLEKKIVKGARAILVVDQSGKLDFTSLNK